VSNYPSEKPIALAVAAYTNGDLTSEPVTPCGNCRQVIVEEENKSGDEIKVILCGKNKIIVIKGLKNMLPLQFNKASMES
jgi:cytidine deaminase